jgi:phosphoadenosine phosphosulfate reductase
LIIAVLGCHCAARQSIDKRSFNLLGEGLRAVGGKFSAAESSLPMLRTRAALKVKSGESQLYSRFFFFVDDLLAFIKFHSMSATKFRCREAWFMSTTAVAAGLETGAMVAQALANSFRSLDLFRRLAAIREHVRGRIVFTTSFGLEDQAITHAIFSQGLEIELVTLDTGRLFPETHEVWAETERRYGARVAAFAPAHDSLEALIARQGVDGLRSSLAARLDCCAVRKLAPLDRALAAAAAWITGIRAEQSADRALLSPVSFDARRRLIKTNPLFDWTRERTLEFVSAYSVPYNRLHDRGFLSIGCAPCTRAVAPGEPERSGRWWWEQSEKKECGLHTSPDRNSPTQILSQIST